VNRRDCGLTGQQRNRHFVWWLLAQDDRRAGRLAQAKETLGRSKEKRLEVEPISPMAALEERLEIRRAHELLRRLRAGRR
jgi:hypothetical protein